LELQKGKKTLRSKGRTEISEKGIWKEKRRMNLIPW